MTAIKLQQSINIKFLSHSLLAYALLRREEKIFSVVRSETKWTTRTSEWKSEWVWWNKREKERRRRTLFVGLTLVNYPKNLRQRWFFFCYFSRQISSSFIFYIFFFVSSSSLSFSSFLDWKGKKTVEKIEGHFVDSFSMLLKFYEVK
jgi:hypothetical protein